MKSSDHLSDTSGYPGKPVFDPFLSDFLNFNMYQYPQTLCTQYLVFASAMVLQRS